jgi:hypothetical protein
MLIADVVPLEWEVLRWRRLKRGLLQTRLLESLETFLSYNLDYEVYRQKFVDVLTEVLQESLPKSEKSFVQTLARRCSESEPNAVTKVEEILAPTGWKLDVFRDDMRTEKAEEIMHEYAQRDDDAIGLVNDCLAGAGVSMDSLLADALRQQFDYVEENRRNNALREIDRRRAFLGETLRRTLEEVEATELKVIETRPTRAIVVV